MELILPSPKQDNTFDHPWSVQNTGRVDLQLPLLVLQQILGSFLFLLQESQQSKALALEAQNSTESLPAYLRYLYPNDEGIAETLQLYRGNSQRGHTRQQVVLPRNPQVLVL